MRCLLTLLVCIMLSACSTVSVFSSYPQVASDWKQALRAGYAKKALVEVTQHTQGGDGLLYTLEAGRIAQLAGRIDNSKKWFRRAAETYEANDAAARIRASGVAEGAVAMVTNDRAINFKAEPYERIFSYTFQALNYLAEGNMTGAGVEFRRVDYAQHQQELSHQEAIAEAEAEGDKAISLDQYQGCFSGLNAAASLVRSGIQNAYSYYLSAAFWEGRGQYNDALVDYKKALQIVPQADFIKADVERVSALLNGATRQKGLLVVAVEQGFVPSKVPLSLPIPTIHGTLKISVPVYAGHRMASPTPFRIRVGDHTAATRSVVRVGGMAAYALKQDMPAILARQIARATAKYALQKQANKQSGWLGLITQVYNLVSERPDLRSWLTLPANGQIARLSLSPGMRQVQLSYPGGGASLTVPIKAQGVTLLRIIDLGGRLMTQVMPITGEE